MAEQDQYSGFQPQAYGAPDPSPLPPAAPGYIPQTPDPAAPPVMVRPLSTGEVLDRTFALYRRNFWLFVAIGAMPSLVLTLMGIVRVVYTTLTHTTLSVTPGQTPQATSAVMGNLLLLQAYTVPVGILFVLAYGVSHAAVVYAVGAINGGGTPTAGESYRAVRGRWLRWIGVAFRQYWSAFWPILPAIILFIGAAAALNLVAGGGKIVLGLLAVLAWLGIIVGVVFGVLNFLRNALAMPAAVQENLGVGAALRRSSALTKDRRGRIFLTLLLVYVLQGVVGAAETPLALLALGSHGARQVILETIQLIIQFVAISLVSPIASIALCLFYIDERVRREGFDIELLMARVFARPPSPAAPLTEE